MKNNSTKTIDDSCKVCGKQIEPFFKQMNVPVNSVRLFSNEKAAIAYPRGNIILGYCNVCGFIQNSAFDNSLVYYDKDYYPSQSKSGTFNLFHDNLARKLIDKYALRNKEILEIGCGQGEFLDLLNRIGNNYCTGFDPACRKQSYVNVRLIPDMYNSEIATVYADFVCCKMTLEHIVDIKRFVSHASASLKDQDSVIFFQVPDTERILREAAFWDIYYEHCSYFFSDSLKALFGFCGLEVLDLYKDYDGQYLMIEAKPRSGKKIPRSLEGLRLPVKCFQKRCREKAEYWSRFIENKKCVVLWGGGSKAVAFLSGISQEKIEYVVDIDERKHGTFIAGTGQEIISPEELKNCKPDLVIVMNAIYENEIKKLITKLEIATEIVCL